MKVRLSQVNGVVEMSISDNGRGFEMENVDMINQFGLQGMRARTEMLGGKLEVESWPGRGTTIQLAWGRKT